jgi:hypothetical protein
VADERSVEVQGLGELAQELALLERVGSIATRAAA